LASIDRLEVARGQRSAAREGALIGGAIGATLGGLAAAFFSALACDIPGGGCESSVEPYLVLAGGGAAAGAGLGALAGLTVRKERWEPVRLDRVRVGIAPARGGTGLQLTARW
jgi:hypothetical protein